VALFERAGVVRAAVAKSKMGAVQPSGRLICAALRPSKPSKLPLMTGLHPDDFPIGEGRLA
jgi:hypothetical protein